MSRTTLRGNLEQDVLAQVKVFSDWKQQEGKVYNLEEMETQALAVAKEVARALLSYGVADERQVEQQQRPEVEPKCPECGKGMRYGGQRGKRWGARREITTASRYYTEIGSFPAAFLRLPPENNSILFFTLSPRRRPRLQYNIC